MPVMIASYINISNDERFFNIINQSMLPFKMEMWLNYCNSDLWIYRQHRVCGVSLLHTIFPGNIQSSVGEACTD